MWKRISLGLGVLAALVAVALPGAGAAKARYDCPPLTGSVNGLDPRGVDPRSPDPLAGLSFFVDPEEPSVGDYRRYLARGQRGKAALVYRLASQPKFKWVGRFTKRGAVRKLRGRAQGEERGSVPEFPALRPRGKRGGGGYPGGAAAAAARARAWYRHFAEEIGDARVV